MLRKNTRIDTLSIPAESANSQRRQSACENLFRLLRHPFAAPKGFRIARGDNRLLWKSARLRLRGASLSERVGRLLAALACPEPYVAHYMKRLARGLNFTRIVALAPLAARLGADAPQALLPADTS